MDGEFNAKSLCGPFPITFVFKIFVTRLLYLLQAVQVENCATANCARIASRTQYDFETDGTTARLKKKYIRTLLTTRACFVAISNGTGVYTASAHATSVALWVWG